MSGSYAEWPSLFCSMLMFNGCRVVMPNGHFSFSVFSVNVQRVLGSHAEWSFFFVCSVLIFNGCRVVTKERLNVQCLMPS